VSGDSGNAAVYDNSGTPTLKSGITKTEIQTLINVEDGAKDDQTAAEVVSTATTNIAALTVQTALAELDAEKLALAGGTMSGDITMGANDISGTGSVTATTFSGNLIGNILDSNENELVKGTATASAVNEITVTNAATGNGPTISATGSDTNIDLNIEAKGTGIVNTSSDLTVGGAVTLNKIVDNNSLIEGINALSEITMNSMSGRILFPTTRSTTKKVINSFVTSDSIIICTIASTNSEANTIRSVIASNGFFTITMAADPANEQHAVNFLIIN